MTAVRFPLTGLADIEAFAVDDTTAQVTVRGAQREGSLEAGSGRATTGPGATSVTIGGLRADTDNEIAIALDERRSTLAVRTLPEAGRVRSRFATVNDVHLGLEGFGLVKRLRDPDEVPYAVRCLEAAVHEAVDWGAELLIVKGDLTENGSIEQWELARDVLGRLDIPIVITAGNHDVGRRSEIAPVDAIRSLGHAYDPVHVHDLDGVRLVIGDTSVAGRGRGSLDPIAADVLAAASETSGPVFLALHHNLQRTPVPWFWPPGISSVHANSFVRELGAANSNVMISSGHTHRNRRHFLGPHDRIAATEVASTSDYPGVWAGYVVTDTMIRQTVRRIARPDVHRWSETARRAVGGIWPRWSQGRLDDRCVDLVID